MELIADDAESVTIKMSRRPEYARLYDILRTFQSELEGDPCGIDTELMWGSKEQTQAFLAAFFKMADEARQI